ncbi:hypothetical protein C8F01DRAFT_1130048 [Mycena amicta]|nr:hypothetical protein C8F01DRAFT_1130048 [Mycena amicta]
MPSLLDLPTELLHELPQYYPDLYSNLQAHIMGLVQPHQYERVDALRALSQTSVRLRAVFLPMLWSHARAYFTPRNPRRKPRTREKMVENRMAALKRATYLHPHVRSLTVTMEECTVDNWHGMVEFIRVLGVLPNLMNLGIGGLGAYSISLLSTSLAGQSFPTVTALSAYLTPSSIPTLRSFPNLHTLTFGADGTPPDTYASIGAAMPQVTTLNNVFLPANRDLATEFIRTIQHGFPQLQKISLHGNIYPAALQALEHLPSLCYLSVRSRIPLEWEQPLPPNLKAEIITAAKNALRSSLATGRKVLRVEHQRAANDGFVDKVDMFILSA